MTHVTLQRWQNKVRPSEGGSFGALNTAYCRPRGVEGRRTSGLFWFEVFLNFELAPNSSMLDERGVWDRRVQRIVAVLGHRVEPELRHVDVDRLRLRQRVSRQMLILYREFD